MSGPPSRAAPPSPPPEEEEGGASSNERLLAAAKTDDAALLQDALARYAEINHADGLGNSALHYAIMKASTSILDDILTHDECDVDLRNRLNGDTPLHIAVRQQWEEYEGLRLHLVDNLLEAGADTKIRNRHNQRPIDILPPSSPSEDRDSDDGKVRSALRRAEAESMIAASGDVVNDDEDEGFVDPDDIASD